MAARSRRQSEIRQAEGKHSSERQESAVFGEGINIVGYLPYNKLGEKLDKEEKMRRRILLVLMAVFLVVACEKSAALAKTAEEITGKRIVRAAQSATLASEPLFFVDALASERGQPRIYEYPSRRNLLFPSLDTSFFTVNVDGWLYQNKEDQWDFTLTDAFRWERYTYGWCQFKTWENIAVKEEIQILAEKVHFRLTFTNLDSWSHNVGFRYLLDTMVDRNDGALLEHESVGLCTNEVEVSASSSSRVRAFDETTPSLLGVFENVTGQLDKLTLAYWPTAQATLWSYYPDSGQAFFTPGYYNTPESDSCILAYWTVGTLLAGETKSIELTYGIPGEMLAESTSMGPTTSWYPLVGQLHSHFMADSVELEWEGLGIDLPVALGKDITPLELQRRYAKRDYDFCAATEHYPEFSSNIENLWSNHQTPEAMIDCQDSFEDTAATSHILGIGFDSASTDFDKRLAGTDERQKRVAQIQNAGGLAIVPHPNEKRYAWSKEQIIAASPDAIEIFNASIYGAYKTVFSPGAAYARGFALGLWDDLLRSGRQIWGTADDDYTPNYAAWFAQSAVVVCSPSETPNFAELRDLIRQGAFYAVKGDWRNAPQVLGWWYDPVGKKAVLELSAKPWYVKFVSQKWYQTTWVMPVQVGSIWVAEFPADTDDKFVRAEVHTGNATVYLQPIFLNPLLQSSGSIQGQMRAASLNVIELAEARLELDSAAAPVNLLGELVPISLRPSLVGLPAGIIGNCYRFSPEVSLALPGSLTISFDPARLEVAPERLRIYQYLNEVWSPLPTTLSDNQVRATISSLGIFALSAISTEDTIAPEVAIVQPGSGTAISAPVEVIASASDNQGVVEVLLHLDDQPIECPRWKDVNWHFLVDFGPYPAGEHQLRAIARDLAGNAGMAEITINISQGTPPPTLALFSPTSEEEIWPYLVAKGTWQDDGGLTDGVLLANGVPVGPIEFATDHTWKAHGPIPVTTGIPTEVVIRVTAWDAFANQAQCQITCPVKLFADVPAGFWAFEHIYAIASAGISQGYDVEPLEYRPSQIVTRDQMAVFIARALAGSDANIPAGPATSSFSDVKADFWAYKHIEYLKTRNIVAGYSDGTYRPVIPVTRDQMAVYIARALCGSDELLPAGPATPTFSDVTTNYWAYDWIEYLAGEGIVKGYPDGTYQPLQVVTRDQMAVYLARAFVF